ncbi:hypothetical protein [Ralstonia mannitolilytica]|uniref:hypothetical protein n=1 Tax=Ralstonia mannitolilytica TaxID=105219 RepID=UPI00292FC1B1|nr:hypothetical protein [Ralstonia mannitolilytica]
MTSNRHPRQPQPDWSALWQRGKWIAAGLPQNGWSRVPAPHSEGSGGFCQRCCASIRGTAQLLCHPSYDGVLRVDALCARQLLQASQATSAYERLPPRSRAAKRLLWIDRSWWRDEAGCAYLRADGYLVLSYAHKGAWRFEVRKIGVQRADRTGSGYSTDEAARLAAFDAITDLLLAKARRSTRTQYVSREAA